MPLGQNININRNLEEVDFNSHWWLEEFNMLVEEVTADMVEIARQLKVRP